MSIILSHWKKYLCYMWFLLLQIYNCCPWKYMYIYAYLICLSCYLFCYVNKFKVSEIWIISQIFCVQTRSTATLTELRYTRGPQSIFFMLALTMKRLSTPGLDDFLWLFFIVFMLKLNLFQYHGMKWPYQNVVTLTNLVELTSFQFTGKCVLWIDK